jgi:hypothetical protein
MINKQRISIRLNKNLNQAFKDEAKKIGLPRSKLLDRWISEIANLQIKNLKNKLRTSFIKNHNETFNFYLNLESKRNIESIAIKFSLTITDVLTSIIYISLNNSFNSAVKSKDSSSILDNLWMEGRLQTILEKLDSNVEKLEKKELLTLSKAAIECGYLDKADSAIKLLATTNLTDLEKIQCMSMQVDILTYNGKLQESKTLLNRAIYEQSKIKHSNFLGRLYMQKAELAILEEKYDLVKKNFSKAIKYFNPLKNPIEVAELYIQLTAMESRNYNWCLTEKYFTYAKSLIDKTDNEYYKGWIRNEMAMCYGNIGEYKKALNLIEDSKSFHKRSGSMIKLYYADTIKTSIISSIGFSYKYIYNTINSGLQTKEFLKFSSPFTTFDFAILMHQAKSAYFRSRSIFLMKQQISGNNTIFINYLKNAMDYIYGDEIIKDDGRKNLLKMLNESLTDKTVFRGIKETLEKKQFTYFR